MRIEEAADEEVGFIGPAMMGSPGQAFQFGVWMHLRHVGARGPTGKLAAHQDSLRLQRGYLSNRPVEVIGNYHEDGYAHIRGLIPKEVARAFMAGLKAATGGKSIPVNAPQHYPAVLMRPAFDVGPGVFQPLDYFLWGLTPIMSEVIGREVLPSYGYFRVYRKGDRCRVHSDRPSSEHGVSMTLEYSDGEIWNLQMGKERTETLYPLADDFGSDPYESIGMEIGDAVLYQATNYPHGRIDPNPNAWSAHLFLFYVDRDGPYRNCAFDEKADFEKVSFNFV